MDGWIGLGASGDSINNFYNLNPLFSISITNEVTGEGELIFGVDSQKVDLSDSIYQIKTDENWKFLIEEFSFGDNYDATGLEYDMYGVFSLQNGKYDQKPLSLSPQIHKVVMNVLATKYNADCGEGFCTFSGDIDILPPIGLNNFIIPASLYMLKQDDGTYVTNFAKYNFARKDTLDYTIIGWAIMSKYYTVFQKTEDKFSIELYSKSQSQEISSAKSTSPAKGSHLTIFIITGVVSAIMIGLIVYCINRWRQNKQHEEQDEKELNLQLKLRCGSLSTNETNLSIL